MEFKQKIEKYNGRYLEEKFLGEILLQLFPNENIIHNRKLLNFRPDYYIPSKNIVIEFDGPLHYTDSKTIIRDFKKDKDYKEINIDVIRLPYFIQLTSEVISLLFNINFNIEKEYLHGFINEKVILPSNFCSLGIKRFEEDLEKFKIVKDEIIESLNYKIQLLNNVDLVLPINFNI